MKREEYDGSEWWNLIYIPDISSLNKKVKKVSMLATPRIGWETLNVMNFVRGVN